VKIWVDADACPGAIKEIILRAAQRLEVHAVFVANKPLKLPVSKFVSSERVGAGLDVADGRIVQAAAAGDLAITADIPLAAALVAKQVITLDPRGGLFTEESIGEVLALRNFHQELRESGVQTGGPKGFGPRDAQQFASAFDRELTRALRGKK
jgi:uncharacterized protein YaiI (UPF0178 family)